MLPAILELVPAGGSIASFVGCSAGRLLGYSAARDKIGGRLAATKSACGGVLGGKKKRAKRAAQRVKWQARVSCALERNEQVAAAGLTGQHSSVRYCGAPITSERQVLVESSRIEATNCEPIPNRATPLLHHFGKATNNGTQSASSNWTQLAPS